MDKLLLLNGERVLAEVAELARLHISGILGVEVKDVSVKFSLEPGGKINPEFNVQTTENAGAWEKKIIQEKIAEVWLGWGRQELINRLAGLQEVRYGFKKEAPDKTQA